MKKNLLLPLLLLLVLIGCKHPKHVQKETLNVTAKNYLDDFKEFVDTLTYYHPALYEFTPKDKFQLKVEELKHQFNNKTTKRDLLWKLEEVIAMAGCSHTNLGFFGSYNTLLSIDEYFPVQARIIKDQFIVTDPLVNTKNVQKGDIITSINGVPVNKILNTIYDHIQGQAHIKSGKKGMLNAFQDLYIPFALNFPNNYVIEVLHKKGQINLSPLSTSPKYPPMISPNSPCQKDFCLNELNSNTTLLTLRTFSYYGDQTAEYTNFLDQSFKTIAEKGYSNLIIDLRGNLGGSSAIARHLLKHTLDEPFIFFAKNDFGNLDQIQPFENNFQGKIIVLINGDGFSSVGQLASLYQEKKRVSFVGEPLGSNHFCTANQKRFQLTNTKFNYTVARNIFETNVSTNHTHAIINPDFHVEQSFKDYMEDKDVVLEKAIDLLKKQ